MGRTRAAIQPRQVAHSTVATSIKSLAKLTLPSDHEALQKTEDWNNWHTIHALKIVRNWQANILVQDLESPSTPYLLKINYFTCIWKQKSAILVLEFWLQNCCQLQRWFDSVWISNLTGCIIFLQVCFCCANNGLKETIAIKAFPISRLSMWGNFTRVKEYLVINLPNSFSLQIWDQLVILKRKKLIQCVGIKRFEIIL